MYCKKYLYNFAEYTIRWLQSLSGGGDSLLDTEIYVSGQTPSYKGTTPTKTSDSTYDYIFSGWNPAIAIVTQDQDYYATFNQLYRYNLSAAGCLRALTSYTIRVNGRDVATNNSAIVHTGDYFTFSYVAKSGYTYSSQTNSSGTISSSDVVNTFKLTRDGIFRYNRSRSKGSLQTDKTSYSFTFSAIGLDGQAWNQTWSTSFSSGGESSQPLYDSQTGYASYTGFGYGDTITITTSDTDILDGFELLTDPMSISETKTTVATATKISSNTWQLVVPQLSDFTLRTSNSRSLFFNPILK